MMVQYWADINLHWLPEEERIQIKVLTLVYKCLNNQAPLYLQQLVEYQDSERATRSSGKALLKILQKQKENISG